MTVTIIIIAIALLIYLTRRVDNAFTQNTDEYIISNSNISLNWQYLNSIPSAEKNFILKVIQKFNFNYFSQFDYNIPLALIYSVLWMESRSQILRDVPNNLIIGDSGNSIGFMQVYKFGAVKEYASQKNMSVNDVWNLAHQEKYNFEIGLFYLQICYNKGLKTNNPIFLSLKCYNGGIGQTLTSKNAKAENYANSGLVIYNHLTKTFS